MNLLDRMRDVTSGKRHTQTHTYTHKPTGTKPRLRALNVIPKALN